MRVQNGICIETRERVWVDDDPQASREFMQEVKTTAPGKRFFSDFASEENMQKVVEGVAKLYPDAEYITLSAFVDTLGTLIAAGELTPTHAPEPVLPEAPATPVPVDRNGRPLTQAQIDWAEMAAFANERPMREINERKRIDPKFRTFIQTNLRRDMQQEIDGDVTPFNPHLKPQAPPSVSALENERLVEFARQWKLMPADTIRKAKRQDTNPLGAAQFEKDEADCFRLRLL